MTRNASRNPVMSIAASIGAAPIQGENAETAKRLLDRRDERCNAHRGVGAISPA